MNQETFIRYFNGTISRHEEQKLLDWIEASDENRQQFLRERQLWDMLLLHHPDEVPADMPVIVPEPETRSRTRSMVIEFSKIAAVFAVAFALSFFLMRNKQQVEEISWNTIEVPAGQRSHLTLADGTKVWLNAKTKFTFPGKFTTGNRYVKLDGEAVFDVAHNEQQPFIVETQKYNVKVLGTEFNVYAYSQSQTFETTLLKGKVLIEKSDSEDKPVELMPDQMASFNESNGQLELKNVNTQQSVFWREGIYSFENQSLESIFQRLERYYEVEFDIRNKKILQDNFTGKFRYRDPIDVILEVVKQSSKFRYTRQNNRITIY